MKLIRFVRRVFMAPFGEDGGGGGGVIESPAAAHVAAPAVPDSSTSAPAVPAIVAAPAAPAAPKPTMLDAITKGLDKTTAAPGSPAAPRDPSGRFVPKVGADGKVLPGQPAAGSPVAAQPGAADPNAPADDDLLTMPEGLADKAKQRFEKLVSTNKEMAGKVDMLDRQVGYIRDTFATHGVKQEQFEQAAGVIGMINKGDYQGAQRILENQLQQLAVMSGKPLAQVDALASFPDLREAVDGMQITEQHAMEIARGRAQQHQQNVGQQRTQQAQQTQQQEQQAVQSGTTAVDTFCKRMQASDLDYGAIEAQLLPEIPNLLQGVAPKDWARVVETQYRLIKKVAGAARQGAPSAGSNPLRATGHGSPQQAPKSMHEAMWGAPAPR